MHGGQRGADGDYAYSWCPKSFSWARDQLHRLSARNDDTGHCFRPRAAGSLCMDHYMHECLLCFCDGWRRSHRRRAYREGLGNEVIGGLRVRAIARAGDVSNRCEESHVQCHRFRGEASTWYGLSDGKMRLRHVATNAFCRTSRGTRWLRMRSCPDANNLAQAPRCLPV